MSFLTRETIKLRQTLMPFSTAMAANRIVNYLSFYISPSSKHLYNTPQLYSHLALNKLFSSSFNENSIEYDDSINVEHLFARTLLSLHFKDHLLDQKGSFRLYTCLSHLKSFNKQDILQEFLMSKCNVDGLSGKISTKTDLPIHHRRNIYISYGKELPDPISLEQMIIGNPLYKLGNLNKILIFNQNQQMKLQLPDPLEHFCKNYHIKIKLLKDSSIQTLLQFLYMKSKNRILIHELINGQQELFDMKTDSTKHLKVDGKVINPLNLKLMPRELAIFCQRLPTNAVVDQNRGEILKKMRILLNKGPDENLVDPVTTLTFEKLEKNYIHEDIGGQLDETKFGFSMKRYVTTDNFEKNRKNKCNRENPFANN